MIIRKFRSFMMAPAVALILFGAAYNSAVADDIDIYLNPTGAPAAWPVVMFTLDYKSNLKAPTCGGGACAFLTSKTYKNALGVDVPYLTLDAKGEATRFDLYRAVLKYVLNEVGQKDINIGLALNHNQGGGSSCAGPGLTTCTNGAYIRIAAGPLKTPTQRDAFYASLDAIPVPPGSGHPYQGREMFFELFRYFSGQGWYNKNNGVTDDFAANPDPAAVSGANYVSPVTDSCQKLYTVNIMFQVSQADDDSDNAIKAAGSAGGMAGININGSNKDMKTVVRWMYDNDNSPAAIAGKQNVVSYFITENANTTTRSYAGAGVGVAAAEPYLQSDDPETLIKTISSIFRNILSVSASFVAPSVAVNVYNRAQTLNDVFIAMFQADPNGLPAWPGNLKKFRIGLNTTSQLPEIQDVNGANAVAVDGRIKFEALSYWTIANDLPAAPPAPAITDIVNGKDGRIIDRGGAGSKIPGFKLKCTSGTDTVCRPGDYTPGMANPGGNPTNITTRRLLYVSPSDGSLKSLNADVATATDLMSTFGATSVGTCAATDSTSPPTACHLLKYARGLLSDGTTTRAWLMGDLLHSKPIAVNYGNALDPTKPDIRIIVGSNDGFFRMIHNTGSGGNDGVEDWAFMPVEAMPTLKTYAAATATTPPHPYTTDGAVTIYVLDNNGNGNIEAGDKVYAYFGLRRGGKAYYAFDITDPDDPKLLWRITKGSSGSDFAELGQSWSAPKVAQMFHSGNTLAAPVVIFGGGYDPDKDTHPGHGSYTGTAIGSDDDEGNAIFVVDAISGALVWKAVKGASGTYNPSAKALSHPDLNDSIPSDIAVIDTNGNSLVDRLYVGDTGGVMWRIDMSSNDQANWKISKLFSVGRHSVASPTVADDKRFFYPPDYAQTLDGSGSFDAVTVGTGDRENPRDTLITNYFYMYKDRFTDSSVSPSGPTLVHSDFADITAWNCLNDGSCASSPPSLANGWALKLECPPSYPGVCGEKSLATPLTLGGSVFFTSYIPPSSAAAGCNLKEGSGLLYRVSLQTGAAVQNFTTGSTTGLTKDDRVTTLRSPGIPAEVTPLGEGYILRPDLQIDKVMSSSGLKTFWYQKYH